MGTETNRALLSRRRESTARIARLVAEAEARTPEAAARHHRITQSLGLARRRLLALAEAERTASALVEGIGQASLAAEADGLSRNQVFAHLGLSRHLGRKYVAAALAAQARLLSSPSTDEPTDSAGESRGSDLGQELRRMSGEEEGDPDASVACGHAR